MMNASSLSGWREASAPGVTLMSSAASDLDVAFNYAAGTAGVTNEEQVANFGGTPFNLAEDNNAIFHWSPSNFFNHMAAASANVIISLPKPTAATVMGPHVDVIALRDVCKCARILLARILPAPRKATLMFILT
jgi:hypothetical protein